MLRSERSFRSLSLALGLVAVRCLSGTQRADIVACLPVVRRSRAKVPHYPGATAPPLKKRLMQHKPAAVHTVHTAPAPSTAAPKCAAVEFTGHMSESQSDRKLTYIFIILLIYEFINLLI